MLFAENWKEESLVSEFDECEKQLVSKSSLSFSLLSIGLDGGDTRLLTEKFSDFNDSMGDDRVKDDGLL